MKSKKLNNKSICHIDSDGNKFWKNRKGQYHRKDGPATEYTNGDKEWYINGKLHRKDGPAAEYTNGYKEWYINGKLHRKDGPAVEYVGGRKTWYINDKLHRLNGPAIEDDNGYKEWWINDVKYPSEKKYWLKIYKMKLITKKELFLKLL